MRAQFSESTNHGSHSVSTLPERGSAGSFNINRNTISICDPIILSYSLPLVCFRNDSGEFLRFRRVYNLVLHSPQHFSKHNFWMGELLLSPRAANVAL